jgi:2-amino-4-hydroxy-6-hydroxymethyldihydropteridine diphosphokinase
VRTAYLSAGSNIGDRKQHLDAALRFLGGELRIKKVSSFFETEPVGYRDQPWFLNLAIEIETLMSPSELLCLCQDIETSCGRMRTFANAPRTLDLDILLFEDVIMNESGLVIPHPRLSERRFVLEPLAEIAPATMHPVLKRTIGSLLEDCPDQSEVRVFLIS